MVTMQLDHPAGPDRIGPGRSRRLGALRKLGRAAAAHGADGSRFQRTLAQLGRRMAPTDKASARQAAAMLVSQLFFVPLLAQMRAFPIGGRVGGGGRGEEVFGEQLDQRIADIVARNAPGLTTQIESKLSQHSPNSPATTNAPTDNTQREQT